MESTGQGAGPGGAAGVLDAPQPQGGRRVDALVVEEWHPAQHHARDGQHG